MLEIPGLEDVTHGVTESALVVSDRVTSQQVWLVDHWTLQRTDGRTDEIRPDPARAHDLAEQARVAGDWLIARIENDLRSPGIEMWERKSTELAFGYFARTYAESLLVRREIFDLATRSMEDPVLVSALPVRAWIVPTTSKDFLRLCRTSLGFNRQLFSVIATQEHIARKHQIAKSTIRSGDERARRATDPGSAGGGPMRSLLSCTEADSCEHTHCAGNLFVSWHFGLLWALTLGRTRVEGDRSLKSRIGSPDMKARSQTFGDSQGAGIHEKLWGAMEWLFPMSLFERLEEAVTVGDHSPAPRRWVGPIPSLDSDHVTLAVHHRKGTEVYMTQHGGYYGESVPKPSEFHERAASNGFVTWGWSDGGDCFPLPAPRLRYHLDRFRISRILGLLSRKASDPRRILWVTQDALPWDLGLPPRSVGALPYTESCRLFRTGLSPAGEEAILVRYRPDKFQVEDDSLRRPHGSVFEGLAIADRQASVHDLLESASLVILDQAFTTTFLECLSRNIPVVAFDPVSFEYTRPERRPIYEELLAVGVIHKDPKTAAVQVEAIKDDVSSWWTEPERERAVAKARAELAQTGPRYFRRWRAFLAGGVTRAVPGGGST